MCIALSLNAGAIALCELLCTAPQCWQLAGLQNMQIKLTLQDPIALLKNTPTTTTATDSSSMALDDFFIDPAELPEGIYGAVQLTFLLVVYGYILFTASNLISDGSELLLLVPSMAGLVGSVVLPVLGAVPDGAIVLFSGLGDDAQTQLSVGVGALAGMCL